MIVDAVAIPDVCDGFGDIDSGYAYTNLGTEFILDEHGIEALLSLDTSESFWVGYDSTGFVEEFLAATRRVLTATLWTAEGSERNVDVFWTHETPELFYVLPYSTVEQYADSSGQHYGYHPCAAFTISYTEYADLLLELE